MSDDNQRPQLPAIWRDPRDVDQAEPWPAPSMPAFREASLTEPAREPTITADVLVPLLQASVGGLLVFGLALLWRMSTADAGTAAVVVTALTWAALLTDGRALLRRVKRVVGSLTSSSPTAPAAVRYEHSVKLDQADGLHHEQILTLPLDDAQLKDFARGVLAGRTGTAAWAATIGRGAFEQTRDGLISAGFARWAGSDRREGWRLTKKGAAWFRGLAGGER